MTFIVLYIFSIVLILKYRKSLWAFCNGFFGSFYSSPKKAHRQTTAYRQTTVRQVNQEIKGGDFERLITEKFDGRYFKMIDWRSDKMHNGKYPESNMYPDFLYEFKLNGISKRFAIECKYRKQFFNDMVEFKSYQLDNYLKYQAKENVPVYIVFGIGNTEKQPKGIYLVPLNELNSHIVSREKMQPYWRGNSNFFFDTNTNILK